MVLPLNIQILCLIISTTALIDRNDDKRIKLDLIMNNYGMNS